MIKTPLQFNVFDEVGNLLCPCCGLIDQFSSPNYDARGGLIGSGICAACFWEPGFDDDPMASADAGPTIILGAAQQDLSLKCGTQPSI
jgi:hypothetical protein